MAWDEGMEGGVEKENFTNLANNLVKHCYTAPPLCTPLSVGCVHGTDHYYVGTTNMLFFFIKIQ